MVVRNSGVLGQLKFRRESRRLRRAVGNKRSARATRSTRGKKHTRCRKHVNIDKIPMNIYEENTIRNFWVQNECI